MLSLNAFGLPLAHSDVIARATGIRKRICPRRLDRALAKQLRWHWDHIRDQAVVLARSDYPVLIAGVEGGGRSRHD